MLFNATGLPKQAISPILSLAEHSSVLLIVETWLLSPNRYPTHWKQYHTYGIKTHPLATKGSQGISLLVNPACQFHVHHLPNDDSQLSQYKLSFTIKDVLIHCVYFPPSLDNQTIAEALDSLPKTTPHTNQTIICGDFNARMGNYTGDHNSNSRGNQLYNWIQQNNLIVWNSRLCFGQPTYMTYQGSSIIDYFLSSNELNNPCLVIRSGLSLDSNHKLMTFSFDIPRTTTDRQPEKRITWRLSRLKSPKIFKQYIKEFETAAQNILKSHTITIATSFRDHQTATTYIEQFNRQLCQAIYHSLDTSCGRRLQPVEPLKDFWTEDMQKAYEYRERCYRKWRKAQGLNKLKYWLKHQEARAALRRLIQKRRKENWEYFCQQLASSQYAKAIAKISRIRKRRTISPTFSTMEGPKHSADTMARHLENVYSREATQEMQRYEVSSDCLPFELTCPITLPDIISAIRSLPSNKAPGVDHVKNEMLLPIQHLLAPILLALFQLCWKWSYVPESWRVAQVVPIHKKGAPTDPGNFRPISLTSTFRKILERCLQNDLQLYSPPIDIAQGGFRECRGSLDQALCLAEICQILRIHHKIKPTLIFLDIKSAYDTVDRNLIWQSLQPTTPPPLLALLQHLFDQLHL
ncbi:hypothetical protein G6F66_001737 [Rhizopus arrhizus]|nr:hypothetical protein G6F66_001737 [Rhizopus arrhizus]